MTSWMLDLWFDLQLTYFYFWSTYDFGQKNDQIWQPEARWMIFCNIRTDFNFIFGQVSVARKLILNGGAIRPIGLLSWIYNSMTISLCFEGRWHIVPWQTWFIMYDKVCLWTTWLWLSIFSLRMSMMTPSYPVYRPCHVNCCSIWSSASALRVTLRTGNVSTACVMDLHHVINIMLC